VPVVRTSSRGFQAHPLGAEWSAGGCWCELAASYAGTVVSDHEEANGRPDRAEQVPYGDGVFMFLGLLLAGIVVFVALLYGFFWLMFVAYN